ncbi:unnamed protein product, partial [marine sediment metagenome]
QWDSQAQCKVGGDIMTDQIYACTRAASSLGYDLKKTIENAKKQDFTGAVTGLLTITQQT